MSRKIAVFMGTRPEAIKLAPVVAALAQADGLEPYVVNAGQHREMIQQVVDLFNIHVNAELQVMQPNQTLAGLTSKLIERATSLLEEVKPDFVLVQGDTTTAMSAALASFYQKIPVGHVEAGLRTGNIWSPFPEEMNRLMVSRLAELHFAPTEKSQQALLDEKTPCEKVLVTGNTVVDALLMEIERQRQPNIQSQIDAQLQEILGGSVPKDSLILVTGHRRENFGGGFEQICSAIEQLAVNFPEMTIVYPVHLNPNVQEIVHARLGELENVRLIAPQPYSEFVALAASSRLILTDSGGVQEEAPSLGKPVLVMRDTTERPEGVSAGTVKIVGADADRIVTEATKLLTDQSAYDAMANVSNPYGDGNASKRIVERISAYFKE